MAKKRASITKADVEKQARSMGLAFELTADHDWPAVSVFLDMHGEGLLPDVCIVDRKLVDAAPGDRVHGETERDYWRSVEAAAEEIASEAREGRLEEISDRIREEADGSHWVIYNHAQLATLVFSRNDDAIDEEGVINQIDASSMSFSELRQQAAFFAFRQDLEDAVSRLDTDPEDEDEDEED